MLAGVFRLFLPVWNDLFFPLPVLHLGVLRRPAIGDPIRLGILWSAAGAAGKTDDDSYIKDFGEEHGLAEGIDVFLGMLEIGDRKSTRLNSSHSQISYAVFCLKKKKKI